MWVIMSKDRKFIVKGAVRNRNLVSVDKKDCRKRFFVYAQERLAEDASGYTPHGMEQLDDYHWSKKTRDFLEPVKCTMVLEIED